MISFIKTICDRFLHNCFLKKRSLLKKKIVFEKKILVTIILTIVNRGLLFMIVNKGLAFIIKLN